MNPKDYDLTARVAKAVGVPRTTLQSAVDRGEVRGAKLATGTPIVHIESAREWANASDQRRPGPKAKAD